MNQVEEILLRLLEDGIEVDELKTYVGILAILSRDEVHKIQIANSRNGLQQIIGLMEKHIMKVDFVEAACDLLWSLAFNNALVKDMVGRHGSISVIMQAVKLHYLTAPQLLKSASGAVSNLCQINHNQSLIIKQGGPACFLEALKAHMDEVALLPFIIDALASLMVGNEESAIGLSESGIIQLILHIMNKHCTRGDVLKSSSHALAILSDVKGQGGKIAQEGGLKTFLTMMALHLRNGELHRLVVVIFLRMLQEEPRVAKEMAYNKGLQLMLTILPHQLEDQETIAAMSYILYAMTQADVIPCEQGGRGRSLLEEWEEGLDRFHIEALMQVLRRYPDRKDIVRACMRCLVNLSKCPSIVGLIEESGGFEPIFHCVVRSSTAKDVLTCVCVLLKGLLALRRSQQQQQQQQQSDGKETLESHPPFKIEVLPGLLLCINAKPHEPQVAQVAFNTAHQALLKDGGSLGGDLDRKCFSCALRWASYVSAANKGETLESDDLLAIQACVSFLRPLLAHQRASLLRGEVDQGGGGGQGRRRSWDQEVLAIFKPLQELLPPQSQAWSDVDAMLCSGKDTDLLIDDKEGQDDGGRDEIGHRSEEVGSDRLDKSQGVQDDQARPESSSTRASKPRQAGAAFLNPNQEAQKLLSTSPPFLEPMLVKTADDVNGSDGEGDQQQQQQDSSIINLSTSDTGDLLSVPPKVPSAISGAPPQLLVVYEGPSAAGLGHESKVPMPMPYEAPEETSRPRPRPFSHSLRFDSAFESGNLFRAVQIGENEYDVFLRPDLHTQGYTQWFFFAVTGTHPPELLRRVKKSGESVISRVTFNIVNLTKPDSLFNQGMRPVLYSRHDAESKGLGWVRAGQQIQYRANEYVRQTMPAAAAAGEGVGTYHSLSFTIDFHNANDVYFLAHSYPYTYSDHKTHIAQLMSPASSSRHHLRRSTLCMTLAGHECDLITITDFVNDGEEDDPRQKRKKRIVFSARVHPGETPASWMMRGVLDFLTSDSREAIFLRHMFVFYIVPFLNPDGVVLGNNRCSLAGVDLNRQWKRPDRNLHPTIFATKMLLRNERVADRDVFVYIDFHAHSRKNNIFMYGCDDKRKPRPAVRIFPKLLSWNRLGRNYVSFDDCSFCVKKNREATARVVVAKELDIPNAYTIEASFSGADFGEGLKNHHFNTDHLQAAGAAVCDALIDYLFPNAAHREAILAQPSSSLPDQSKGFNNEAEVQEVTEKVVEEMKGGQEGDDLSSESDDDDKEEEQAGEGERGTSPSAAKQEGTNNKLSAIRQLPPNKSTSSGERRRASSSGSLRSGGGIIRGGGGGPLLRRGRVGSLGGSRESDKGEDDEGIDPPSSSASLLSPSGSSSSKSPCILHQQEMRLRRRLSPKEDRSSSLDSSKTPTAHQQPVSLGRGRFAQRRSIIKVPAAHQRTSSEPSSAVTNAIKSGTSSMAITATPFFSSSSPPPPSSLKKKLSPKGTAAASSSPSPTSGLDVGQLTNVLAKLRFGNRSSHAPTSSSYLAGLGRWERRNEAASNKNGPRGKKSSSSPSNK